MMPVLCVPSSVLMMQATPLTRKLIGLDQWSPAELGAAHTVSELSANQLGLWNGFPELDIACGVDKCREKVVQPK